MEEFSAVELYALLKLRVDVFIVEQACVYPELDGKDADALHLRLFVDGETAAYARLWQPLNGPPRIGRVIVAPAHRGRKLGEALMREAIRACDTHFPAMSIAISAQRHLQHFYASLGFLPSSDAYIEDGIPHIDMLRTAESH